MKYNLITPRMRFEAAVSGWNQSATPAAAGDIIDAVEQMYQENSEVYEACLELPAGNGKVAQISGMAQARGGTWIIAFTSRAQMGEEIPIEPKLLPIRDLFDEAARTDDVDGILFNPRDPFYLQKELILMNWSTVPSPHNSILVSDGESLPKVDARVRWTVSDRGSRGVVARQRKGGLITLEQTLPESLRKKAEKYELREMIWDVMEKIQDQKIHSVAIPTDAYRDKTAHTQKLFLGTEYLTVLQWTRLNYTYPIQVFFTSDDKEVRDFLEQLDKDWKAENITGYDYDG